MELTEKEVLEKTIQLMEQEIEDLNSQISKLEKESIEKDKLLHKLMDMFINSNEKNDKD